MEKNWNGLPYYPISQFYRQRFGEKVYKIPVSVVDNCPNRMGLKGMQTCVFCDIWGSAAKSESFSLTLEEQISKYHLAIQKKFNANQFLVYFQAYTNTFTKVDSLRDHFQRALNYDFVKGLVVGTRPDCLSPAVFKLWNEFNERSFVSVELGVQSFFDDQLVFLRRGHTRAQTLEAIHRIARETQVDLGIHLMFGLPHETDDHIRQTAELINHLPIRNVKLHNLHVLKDTPLESLFLKGEFSPIDLPNYAQRVKLFLQHLSPQVAVHRLAALSSRWEELVAPPWTRNKMGTHQSIIDCLRSEGAYQSQFYCPQSDLDQKLCEKLKTSSSKVEETIPQQIESVP